MDRFRIYSLEKLLKDEKLCERYYHASLDEISNKLNLVINGAKKRKNNDLAKKMLAKKSEYERFVRYDHKQ